MSGTDDASPAEARVSVLLGELQQAPPEPGTDLAVRVVRRARWQRPLKAVLDLTGGLAGAVAHGARLLFGPRRGGAR
jgi:hypothetical protein